MPDFKFNDIVERMLTNVKELSGVSSDYLKLTAEFARTGLNDDQSLELANVATVLQNISELTADEAVNSLTSATIAFKDEITETITVADRLNEIDNNFAITTKDLATALGRTATTAKTYGVTLNELLGYTTAIGVATRE